VIALRKPPKQRKFSTRRPSGQPVLIVFALLFVAALVAGLSLMGNLSAEAVTALGAVTTALVALINVKRSNSEVVSPAPGCATPERVNASNCIAIYLEQFLAARGFIISRASQNLQT
jgi:hypothetical protein